MTTIAWDGNELAADSRLSWNGNVIPGDEVQKLFQLSDGRIAGLAGVYSEVLAIIDWLNANDARVPIPRFKANICGILVSQDGAMQLDGLVRPWPITSRYCAIGSGEQYAVTAMELGKTASEAVAIAARFDLKTGGPIKALRLQSKSVIKRLRVMKRAA